MSGAAPGCGVLSVESRTQASVLVVAHPFCDEFFEEPKRLGPTHSLPEDGWVASSRKQLPAGVTRWACRHGSAHFADPQVCLRRETRRAGDVLRRIGGHANSFIDATWSFRTWGDCGDGWRSRCCAQRASRHRV